MSPDGSYPAPHIHTSPRASTHAPYFSAMTRSRNGVEPSCVSGVGRFRPTVVDSGHSVRYLFVPHPNGVYGLVLTGMRKRDFLVADSAGNSGVSSASAGLVYRCTA